MSSNDSAPAGSELALVGVHGSGDLADSLSEVVLSSLGIIDTFNLEESLVGVLGVSGSTQLEKFRRRKND